MAGAWIQHRENAMEVWLAVELPEEVVDEITRLVRLGRYPSIGSLVTRALELYLARQLHAKNGLGGGKGDGVNTHAHAARGYRAGSEARRPTARLRTRFSNF